MPETEFIENACLLQGTDSRREFSTGNTYPAIGVPRGMTYWAPQTSDGRFLFDRQAKELCGIRATHSPSPWLGDYGHFDIFPMLGPVRPTPQQRSSPCRLEEMVLRPHTCRMRLLRDGIDVRLAATCRCAILEFDFPGTGDAAIVLQTGAAEKRTYGEVVVRDLGSSSEMSGISFSNHGGCPDEYGCYFIVDLRVAPRGVGVFNSQAIMDSMVRYAGPRAGTFVRVEPGQTVLVRVATSFISLEQARLHLQQEIGTRNLRQVAAESRRKWNHWFSKVEVEGGSESERSCFASAMYRVGLFPMVGHEPDGHGNRLHRSPYDGQVHSGRLSTNNGFWDTHRTVYPLLALIDPKGYGQIVDGFLQAYRQTGWLPKWASPGFRDCMISSHFDAVVSEAVLRRIPGFDYQEAYQAIRRNAFEPSQTPAGPGRFGLQQYDRLGFVPADGFLHSVSRTLDFAHCDWCVAQVAQTLGYRQDAATLLARSSNYRNLWDAKAKLMRPRNSDGTWVEPWSPFSWGDGYVEGGAWQHSFNVPHDPQGLANLLGGAGKLLGALETMLGLAPRFQPGSYRETIHEMTEMASATDQQGRSFGQYAHSNQPVHGFLWYPAALGHADWTARQVQRVMRSLYSLDHLPGDEDNGEMSAWYILAAMGRYPLCPGSGKMVWAPCTVFDRVECKGGEGALRRVDRRSSLARPSPKMPEPIRTSRSEQ